MADNRAISTSTDWLADFVAAKSHGEVGPRLLYWTGVSTIAGALRRKVWFDQDEYQWTPNFYTLFVGEPGIVKKSTSIDMGMRLLHALPEINFGPEIVTWQSLLQYIAESRDPVIFDDPDRPFFHSSVTIALSEFGTFFKADDQDMIDNLTNLFDGKIGTIQKMTKNNGCDDLVNSFINIIAATTPKWIAKNFSDTLINGGFASRCIILYVEDSGIDVAYPAYERTESKAERDAIQQTLIDNLKTIADYQGDYTLTPAAYLWGKAWYARHKAVLRASTDELTRGFTARKQVHLHKLAMVICAARYKFPVIDVAELEEAERRLADLERDAEKIFGYVGQSKISTAARQITEVVAKAPAIDRGTLYRKHFFRTMTAAEFRQAIDSAIMSRIIVETPGRGLSVRADAPMRLVK